MYSLMDDLERIATVLRNAAIPFEVVGGVAVNAHVLEAGPSRAFVTRYVDILVERENLGEIVAAAARAGYEGKRMMGGFALIRAGQALEEAVHLMFVTEKPRSSHPFPNPKLHPEEKKFPQLEMTVPVARLRDLVQMKLNSFRPKDETHLEILDGCGLITNEIESNLPELLRQRLAQARSRYSDETLEE